jgi:Mg2+ and Co2+ transporter CorA
MVTSERHVDHDVSDDTDLHRPRVWTISPHGAQQHETTEIADLLRHEDRFIWVDVPACGTDGVRILSEVFKFAPRAVHDATQRNAIPKVREYPGFLFVVLHAPEKGLLGHVHYLELDLFIGPNYLVTVHGPTNPRVDRRAVIEDTDEVCRALAEGASKPSSLAELATVIMTRISRRLHHHLEALTADVWNLERTVTAGEMAKPEQFLEEMFRVRHGLLAVSTIALLNHEVGERMATLRAFGPDASHDLLVDLVDQFKHIARVAEGQKTYHQGVIEYYQTRTNTKVAIAGERLAVVASVTLPVTALSGVLGMNVIVSERTEWTSVWILIAVMVSISTVILIWTRRQGWW